MTFHRNKLLCFPKFHKFVNLSAYSSSHTDGNATQLDGVSAQTTASTIRFPHFISRQKFTLPSTYAKRDWFPKHMGVQMKVMEGKLRTVDLVIEVHDARVALTGRNPSFGSNLYSVRPHILVFNKMDLISMKRYKEPIEEYYRSMHNITNICWTNCRDVRNKHQFRTLMDKMLDLLRNEHRFNRTVKTEYQVMVVGIPNTGKSSLINALRKVNLEFGRAVKEGSFPGVTIRVQNRVRILDRPLTYLLDTPGVLCPWANNIDAAMKLAICNLVLESTTNPKFVADYLLYFMNKLHDFSYVDFLKMEQPSDDIKNVLIAVSKLCNRTSKVYKVPGLEKTWDLDFAASHFLNLFRKYAKDPFLDRDLLGFKDSLSNDIDNEQKSTQEEKKCIDDYDLFKFTPEVPIK